MWDKVSRFATDRLTDLKNVGGAVSNEIKYAAGQLNDNKTQQSQSWSGVPGQFADKSPLQNGLDALNKAGASPKGFADGNPNDLKLVSNFYTNPKNNGVMNQYDLSTNLYLRYISGKGKEGLEVSPKQKGQISGFIKKQQDNLSDPELVDNIKSNFGEGHVDRIQKGDVPVYFGGWSDAPAPVKGKIPVDIEGAKDASTSLGSFWAKPNTQGGFDVEEDYNFAYAPKKDGGSGYQPTVKQAKTHYGSNPVQWYKPQNVAGRHAISGYGTPFKYTISVP